MRAALLRLAVPLIAAIGLMGCGQKGPLCLREPAPTAVPAAGSAPPAAAASTAPESTPPHPLVPGYSRCR